MEETLFDIFKHLESTPFLDDRALTRIINKHNKRLMEEAKRVGAQRAVAKGTAAKEAVTEHAGAKRAVAKGASAQETSAQEASAQDGAVQTTAPADPTDAGNALPKPSPTRPLSKRRLMAYYLSVKRNDPERWARWNLSEEMQRRVVRTLQMKPRRTASGVATITVLTKPWKCSSNCLYCPNDLRMPKSYLADEPACQRAERTFFDPYLQVAARLKALTEMGHVTDKVELIVLGGTWSDYPLDYQIWFVRELFRALNDGAQAQANVPARRAHYEEAGISSDPATLKEEVRPLQQRIFDRELTYNQAFDLHYGQSAAWHQASQWQTATWQELEHEHHVNESADHRVVGLVIETRPERVTPKHALTLRRLGCTKVQMGIQSLDGAIREENDRHTSTAQIQRAFEVLRLFGFKTHIHAMVNLLGATPELDKQDYQRLVSEAPYQPDEIKLYPCVLVNGTGLCAHFEDGSWQPYDEKTLVDVLVQDTCATPAFTRISRMIRDISAPDIMAGNKKVNLRQLVEARIDQEGLATREIRHREVSLSTLDASTLRLEIVPYETTATSERFLQWVTPEGKIAGFLRLSLPQADALAALNEALDETTNAASAKPESEAGAWHFSADEAMIREVHVYGRVAKLNKHDTSSSGGAQHHGLGTQLIQRACELAREAGYARINVISAIGTRGYYRKLGFADKGLYQQRSLE